MKRFYRQNRVGRGSFKQSGLFQGTLPSYYGARSVYGANHSTDACVLVIQSCPPLWDPMDCSPPGSSVHGILQARILEWVTSILKINGKPDLATPFSRGSSWSRDRTRVSCIAGRFFTVWTTTGYWLGDSRLTGWRRSWLKDYFPGRGWNCN